MIALLLISLGNGSIKACVVALGGHQFELPKEKPILDRYFSIKYFLYTIGMLASKVLPSQIRESFEYQGVFATTALVFLFSWSKYFLYRLKKKCDIFQSAKFMITLYLKT